MTTCEACGSCVKVVGNVTMSYEPSELELENERLREALERSHHEMSALRKFFSFLDCLGSGIILGFGVAPFTATEPKAQGDDGAALEHPCKNVCSDAADEDRCMCGEDYCCECGAEEWAGE